MAERPKELKLIQIRLPFQEGHSLDSWISNPLLMKPGMIKMGRSSGGGIDMEEATSSGEETMAFFDVDNNENSAGSEVSLTGQQLGVMQSSMLAASVCSKENSHRAQLRFSINTINSKMLLVMILVFVKYVEATT
jgi:hypothetical protein